MFAPMIAAALLATTVSPQADPPRRPAMVASDGAARALVEASLRAMLGGGDVRTIRRTVRTATYHLADRDHVGPPYAADVGDATITDDLGGRRLTTSTVASATGTSIQSRTVADAAAQTTSILQGDRVTAVRATPARPLWVLDQPIAALRRALAAADLHVVGRAVVHQVPVTIVGFTAAGSPVKIAIGDANHLPLQSEAVVAMPHEIAWSSRGDIVERFEWQNWTMTHGVRVPFQIDVFLNNEPAQAVMVTAIEVNTDVPADAFAADATALAALDQPGARDVDRIPLGRPDRPIAEIAPNVVQIPGPWYSTIVRQADGLVVIDAPISNGYSQQVMAEAARRFPGIPIKAVVTTTSFNWHTAGLREYIARGIPVYALAQNASAVRALIDAPHTLRPDALARSKRKPDIRLVDDHLTLGTGDNRLELMRVRNSNAPMMMAYFPGHALLHTAEMVQPLGPGGAFLFPEALREIADEVADRHLRVDSIIGMHMSPTPWAQVAQTLAADAAGKS